MCFGEIWLAGVERSSGPVVGDVRPRVSMDLNPGLPALESLRDLGQRLRAEVLSPCGQPERGCDRLRDTRLRVGAIL